tara:strand:+ start:481 stop:1581 length:1101 start_codon:yes stop_codon:yes gene_type:complete
MATTNNAIFNYESFKWHAPISETEYTISYPYDNLKPKMGPLRKNERNEFLKYLTQKQNKYYHLSFKKPQMFKKEIEERVFFSVPNDRPISNTPDVQYVIEENYFNYNQKSYEINGYTYAYTHQNYEINPYHFRRMYRKLQEMMDLKWKDIKEINEGETEYGIKTKYDEILEWAMAMVKKYNQTENWQMKDAKVGIMKRIPQQQRWEYYDDWQTKKFNSSSWGNGKNNWFRSWCQEFIQEFRYINYLMTCAIYHYEKTMRMRTALAKISAWFLRIKYDPKYKYAQKWLWEDFEDICEDEDDRRHNPFYEKDNNLRQIMERTYECPICYETEHAEKAKTLKCGHKFCRDCINKCLKIKKECPYCRAPQ